MAAIRAVEVRGWITGRRRPARRLAVAAKALAMVRGRSSWMTLAVRGHACQEADMPAAGVVIVLRTEVLADGRLSDRLVGSPASRAASRQRLRPW